MSLEFVTVGHIGHREKVLFFRSVRSTHQVKFVCSSLYDRQYVRGRRETTGGETRLEPFATNLVCVPEHTCPVGSEMIEWSDAIFGGTNQSRSQYTGPCGFQSFASIDCV